MCEKDRLKLLFAFFYDADGHTNLWDLIDVAQPSASTPAVQRTGPPASTRVVHTSLLKAAAEVIPLALPHSSLITPHMRCRGVSYCKQRNMISLLPSPPISGIGADTHADKRMVFDSHSRITCNCTNRRTRLSWSRLDFDGLQLEWGWLEKKTCCKR
jgi:hypothetical protein